ncbi:DUF4430 domain-containing protein [Tepidibacter formicigenes]|uniref:Transcobalamin-like C-terminal domain-containing protein n=1 Tax=Tepidibacter formicigenes DSM 15518 TaxID=1123349 RepID=A0A1M6QRE2_9FIRM|nr:DUF4430 domain-containing protein [Tepidibacter formicigenes]SHK22688.1 protein of unknown function [Tepidibacter formicigenes DSM 15518]
MKKVFIFFIAIILTFSLIGCSDTSVSGNENINLIVSKDFGNEQIYDEELGFKKDTSVMEVMEENLEIETAYGGGFISSINGIKSGFTGSKNKKKLDWFYYVNGNLAQVGADDYYLNPGDSVIWDYHDWSNEMYISSIIGAYPKNFTNGYEGNILKAEIRYSKEFKEDSEKLLEFLKEKGLEHSEQKKLDEKDIENEEVNTIVIGKWDEVSKISYISDIYNSKNNGMFFKIENKVKALNYNKEISKEYEKAAVIVAIPKGYGTGSNLWIITGNDEQSIKDAVAILYKTPEKIKGMFSAVISGNRVINIPTKN